MNMKKLGLTALASSLVVTSAVAGEMSVSGGAFIGLKNTTESSSGRSWTMGNQLTFTGSGELTMVWTYLYLSFLTKTMTQLGETARGKLSIWQSL